MFADGLSLGVHALRVVAVCDKYLRSERLQLQVESPLGGWLCTVHTDLFSTGEELTGGIVEQLGVCDVVPVMREREHDADCLNTSHGFGCMGEPSTPDSHMISGSLSLDTTRYISGARQKFKTVSTPPTLLW